MICPHCGAENPDNIINCLACEENLTINNLESVELQSYQNYQTVPQKINNYFVWSILNTMFCCQPFGIAATVFSCKVNSALASGNLEAATKASKNAKIWNLVSTISGALVYVGTFLFILISALEEMF